LRLSAVESDVLILLSVMIKLFIANTLPGE
jgi:hypothetical protein